MKLYKRQVRPMISPPALHGMNCHNYPLEECMCGEEIWYDEEYVINSKDMDMWENQVLRREGPCAKLVFQERYVPVTKDDFVKHISTFDFDYDES
jgi:hypothetical protein